MTIGRNKNGVIYWTDYIDGKRVKRENKMWRTQKEAREHHAAFIEKIDRNEETVHNLKFDDLIDRYIDHISLSYKLSTVNGIEKRLRNTIRDYFGNTYIKQIDRYSVQKFQKSILNKEYKSNGQLKRLSNSYLYSLQSSLNGMLEFALNFGYLTENPFDQVPIVKQRVYRPKKKMTILTREEFSIFINSIDDQVYSALFNILYWCGLRIGEVMALNIADYDSERKVIHVYKTYDNSNRVVTTTKTDSDRFVSVPDVCSNEIDKLIESYRNSSNEEFVNTNPLFSYDGIISKTTLNRVKKKYIDEVNEIDQLIPYFTFHELRHTHVSTLIDLGMEAKDIAVRLGHSVEMVNNTYSHLFPERKDALLEKLNDFSKKI